MIATSIRHAPVPAHECRGRRLARLLVVLLAGWIAGIAQAQVSTTVATRLQLAPGASGSLTIPVQNTTAYAATIELQGYYFGPASPNDEYVFTDVSDSRCEVPQLSTLSGRARTVVGPLAANETLACTWRVTRTASSRNDLLFGICAADAMFCNVYAAVGTLPDLTLQSIAHGPASIGDDSVLVRIGAHNPSAVATAPRRFHTDCLQFLPGVGAEVPFEIENDFAGACPTAPLEYGCINFTGTLYERREFFTAAMQPGEESSCLLRLRLRTPLATSVGLDLYFEDFVVPRADGGTGFDINESNGSTRLVAAPSGSPAATSLPLGGAGSAILGALLLLATAFRLRRVSQRR